MRDDRRSPALQTLETLFQALQDSLGTQAHAIDSAVRRGTLDLGTAAELLELKTRSQVELTLLLEALTRTAGGPGAPGPLAGQRSGQAELRFIPRRL
jgi:hypothetical protein